MSPIYENLVDKESSDVYLKAQMNGLFYSSTPVPVNVVNVAPPQVMTATSQATHHGIHENRIGSIIPAEEIAIPNPSSPKPRTPLRQLSFNTPRRQRQKPNNMHKSSVRTQKQVNLDVSIYDNVPEDNAKENKPQPFQRAQTSTKKRPKRRSEQLPRQHVHNDLRRKALMRNWSYSYQPIREQDIDGVFINSNNKKTTPGPLRRLESRALTSEVMSSQVQFEQTEPESPTSPSSKTTLPSDEMLRKFDCKPPRAQIRS